MTTPTSHHQVDVLSAVRWEFERSYRAISYDFRVRTNVPRAGSVLDRLLAPFRIPTAGDARTYSLVLTKNGRFPFTLYVDDAQMQEVESAASMLDFVLADVTIQSVERMEDHVGLHAAAAAWDGQGIILPGEPDAGKTTLVAGLTQAGFAYLSDEAALIDPLTGLLHPYPRALAMDARSVDVIPGLRESLPPDYEEFMRFRFHVSPDDLRRGSVGRPCRVRYVIAPRYEPGVETALEPMTRAEALMMLAENSFNFVRFGGLAVESLRGTLENVSCYRLRIGSLEDAVRQVLNVVGEKALA
jgi:hypothetical protein